MGGMETRCSPAPPASDDRALADLQRIANVIGCPVSAFFGGPTGIAELDATFELLRLWDAIHSMEDRQRLLAAAHDIAGG